MSRRWPTVALLATVGLCSTARCVAAPLAFVTNQGPDTVTVLDLATGSTQATVAVGKDPAGVAWDAKHQRVFVTNPGGASVSVIELAQPGQAHSFPSGKSPLGIAVDPVRDRVYVADFYDRQVEIFSTADFSPQGRLHVGNTPSGLAPSADGRWLAVANRDDDTVALVDLVTG